jgi:hypothetical protein
VPVDRDDPPRRLGSHATPIGAAADVSPSEASIPRWRRPSVQEARFASVDVRTHALREKLAFRTPPGPGVERLAVRYDLVTLLDSPDDRFAGGVAELRSGDEVEVIARQDEWVQARTPRGIVGWIQASIVQPIGRRRGAAVDAGDAGEQGLAVGTAPAEAPRPKGTAKTRRSPSRTATRAASKPARSAGRARSLPDTA